MRESDGANKENGEYKYGNGTKDVVAITTQLSETAVFVYNFV